MTDEPATSLEQLIQREQAHFSSADRRLAEVVLAQAGDVLGYSATELAAMAGVSKASAARFFRRLGFSGFEAFRQQVRDQLARQSPLARIGQGQGQGVDPALQPLQTHALNDARRLQAWAASLQGDTLEAALELLARARKLRVLGYRHSHVTALYASALLSQVRPDVQLINDAAGREAELLAGLDGRDLLLAVDFRRRASRLPRVIAAARAAGARVLLLSDTRVSALAAQADVLLPAAADGPEGLFDSYVCAISLVNHLASALAARGRGPARAHLARIERMHAALGDLEP